MATQCYENAQLIIPLLSQCFGYVKNWALQIQHYWGNWNPVSGCQYTGKDEKGSGSYTLGWSYSVAISENAGYVLMIR